MKRKAVYTTGEAAEICNLSQQTIIRCFDSGQLQGFRVPGSKFRRIPHDDLVRFMKENGIPLDNVRNVREYREARDLTQGDLASNVGVTRQSINAIERGRYDPSLELALKLAAEFDSRVEDLFWMD